MFYCDFCKISKNTFFRRRLNVGWYKSRHNSKTTHNYNSVTCLRRRVWTITLRGIIPSQSEKEPKQKTKKPWKTIFWFIVYSKSVIIHLTLKKKDRKRTFGWRKFYYYYTLFFTRTHFIRTSKLRLGKNKNKLKTRWSPDNARKNIYHIYIYIYMFREIL